MGLGHHQLRLVGWYRSRRYADFGHPSPFPSGLENRGEPCSRGHDNFRGNVCWSIPDLPHGKGLDGILHPALSQYTWSTLAQLQLTIVVGRVRDLNLFHCFPPVLVFRFVA